MKHTIIYEKINDPNFDEGYYYAHITSLDLTTHGLGIDGAKETAKDLIKLWIEEKIPSGEKIRLYSESLISTLEIEDALFS